jgi:phage gp36-like protein
VADSYAYCASADLTTRYGDEALLQASDRDGLGVVNTALVTAACADATELMDGYLGERYTLPLTPVTGIVLGWACAIAWYKLQFSPRDEDRLAYTDALDQLERARLGKLVLQANGIADVGIAVEGDAIEISGGPRVFTSCSLRHF